MVKVNIVCTSKPGDGLLYYSYEHCNYLNLLGIKAQLIIVTHFKYSKSDYETSIRNKYIEYKNVIFDEYNPKSKEITLIMGRSMLTLPYLSRKEYTWNQLLTLKLLFKNNLISVYSENHPKEYYEAGSVFGASSWKQFVYITLPLLRRSLQTALIIRLILAFEVFAVVVALGGTLFPVLMEQTYIYQFDLLKIFFFDLCHI